MPFEYYSTRSSDTPVSFEQAVIQGLAPDGGLYLPETVSSPPADFLNSWKDLSFQDLAVEIMSLYIPESEVPRADLRSIVEKSYSTFRSKDVTPVIELNKEKQLYLLELFHGPTYAFKDVALQTLGNLFEYFLSRKNANKAPNASDRDVITVIGATSGDTGSAAIYGLRNKKDVNVFILYPTGRISPIQEQQMTSVLDDNVHTVSVPGTFDDCQDNVKTLFADVAFNDKYHVGAVNSINWSRILSQMTYYFKAYFALNTKEKVTFVVPSGNFGDILAGYYAKEMGLPIDLVIATNQNDILYRFLKDGSYSKDPEVHATLSPAMDILVSSNFERFLWHAVYETVAKKNRAEAGKVLNGFMSDLKTKGTFTVPQEVLQKARSIFSAEHATDSDTIDAIRTTYTELLPKYVVDPHTAVGVHAALVMQKADRINTEKVVVLSTAHPAKFSEAVTKALDSESSFNFENDVLPEEFKKMMLAETKKIFANDTSAEEIKRIVTATLGY